MSPWTARRIAYSVGIVSVLLVLSQIAFVYADRNAALPPDSVGWSVAGILSILVDAGVAVIGMIMASRRPDNRIGWLFLIAGAALGIGHFLQAYSLHALRVAPEGLLPGAFAAAWVGAWIWTIPTGLLPFLFILFPTGHLPSRRWRPLGWLYGFTLVLLLLSAATATLANWTHPFRDPTQATSSITHVAVIGFDICILLFPVNLFSAVAAVVFRYRSGDEVERLQLKWFLSAAALLAVTFSVNFFMNNSVVEALTSVSLFLLYVAIAVAILRYRLLDIDLIIGKTVLYGLLAAAITVIYVAIVVVVGAFVGATEGLSLIATAIVAIAFQPMRDKVARVANRLVYGKRATPYEVLSDFSERLGALASEDIFARMARLLADGTGALEVVVWLRVGGELRPAAISPEEAPMPPPLALLGGGRLPEFPNVTAVAAVRHPDVLGALTILKPPKEPITPAEQRLVDDLAAQAGLIFRNFQLIEDLRSSRQRLVTAQDEERRRLERNLHDGAQQQLVALSVRLKLARNLAQTDVGKADEVMEKLEGDVQQALADLRDLAHGIYPPVLADRGLVEALRSQIARSPIDVRLEPGDIGRYAQEIEAAVYFCVLEALQNVSKYAQASDVVVRLREDRGDLAFAVEDDGKGFDARTTRRGAGLQNMEDRLSALGGSLEVRSRPGEGTVVEGWIPAAQEASDGAAPAAVTSSQPEPVIETEVVPAIRR
jgi:signal transduction histidine kinase